MRELLPGFEKEAPLDAEVSKEAVYFLTEKGKFKFPITPPPLRDHGNYVISLNRFVKWLGSRSEEHTSELQSLRHLVCRLLLEKKKTHTAGSDRLHRPIDQVRGTCRQL